jgi:hypothetical protein
MKSLLTIPWRAWVLAGLGSLLFPEATQAYPPAPDHVFYGLVRDEMGFPLTSSAAMVILETAAGAQIKAMISPNLEPGVNYRLAVPMDAGITDDLYKPTALRPTVPFKIKVQMGKTVYLPIEMKGDFSKMGLPGQRTRLDLTLGEDANGDGLPDAWERALLATYGLPKDLSNLHPTDHLNGNSLSIGQQYVAGVYAYDSREGFTVKAIRANDAVARLEFMAVMGRTYSVYGSADCKSWSPVQFRLPAQGAAAPLLPWYYALDIQIIQVDVQLPAASPAVQFFKLMVQ